MLTHKGSNTSSSSSASSSCCSCVEGSTCCGPFLDLRCSSGSSAFRVRRLQLMLPALREQLLRQQLQQQQQRQQQQQLEQQQEQQQQYEALRDTVHAVCERLAAASEVTNNPVAHGEAVQLLQACRSSAAPQQQQQQQQRQLPLDSEAPRLEAAADQQLPRATRQRLSSSSSSTPGNSSNNSSSSSSRSRCTEGDSEAAHATVTDESCSDRGIQSGLGSRGSGRLVDATAQQQQQQQQHMRQAGSFSGRTSEKNLKAALSAMSQGDYEVRLCHCCFAAAGRFAAAAAARPDAELAQPPVTLPAAGGVAPLWRNADSPAAVSASASTADVLRMRCLSFLLAGPAIVHAAASEAPESAAAAAAATAAAESELLQTLRCLCSSATAAAAVTAAADKKTLKPPQQRNRDAILFRGVFALRRLQFAEAARCCLEALQTAAAADLQQQQQAQQQRLLLAHEDSSFNFGSSSSSSNNLFSAADLAFYGVVALMASPAEALREEGLQLQSSLQVLRVNSPDALQPLLLAIQGCDFAQQAAGIQRAALSFAADLVLRPVAATVAAAMQRRLIVKVTEAYSSLKIASLQQHTCLDTPTLLQIVQDCQDTGELLFDLDKTAQVQQQHFMLRQQQRQRNWPQQQLHSGCAEQRLCGRCWSAAVAAIRTAWASSVEAARCGVGCRFAAGRSRSGESNNAPPFRTCSSSSRKTSSSRSDSSRMSSRQPNGTHAWCSGRRRLVFKPAALPLKQNKEESSSSRSSSSRSSSCESASAQPGEQASPAASPVV
ncbi:hypothetical protein Efla_000938 [Eimeria flavescens]